jgi:hypothetical protein
MSLQILKDVRFYNFQDLLLSSIESNLCSGPVSFDCYPNFTISLKDKSILQSILPQTKTYSYNMLEGSILIALIFKIRYKLCSLSLPTNINFNPKKVKPYFYKLTFQNQTQLYLESSTEKM